MCYVIFKYLEDTCLTLCGRGYIYGQTLHIKLLSIGLELCKTPYDLTAPYNKIGLPSFCKVEIQAIAEGLSAKATSLWIVSQVGGGIGTAPLPTHMPFTRPPTTQPQQTASC